MHFLYYVVLNKEHAENSAEARKHANSTLEENNFSNQEGYWAQGKSDWYVIGGRWSGNLQSIQFKKDFFKEAEKKYSKSKWGLSTEEVKKHDKELQALWESFGGKGTNPYARDSYEHEGYDDDAQLITKELITAFKKHHKGKQSVELFDADNYEESMTKDLTKDDIGRWIVVVDYHN